MRDRKIHLRRGEFGAYCGRYSETMLSHSDVAKVTCGPCQKQAKKENYKREVVWYDTDELIHYIHSVIEDCANVVCPEPHVEEERRCENVAAEIRMLKSQWSDTEFVLRTSNEENLFIRRAHLLQRYGNLTSAEMVELDRLREKIMDLRTARTPDEDDAMSLILRVADQLSKSR